MKTSAEQDRPSRSPSGKSARRDEQSFSKRKATKAGGEFPLLLVACIGGGVVVCLGLVLVLAIVFYNSKKGTREAANESSPSGFESQGSGGAGGHASGNAVYRHVLKSVAWIVLPLGNDEFAMGTGTLVDRTNRLILTNNHVVRNGPSIHVFFPNFRAGRPIAERDNYLAQLQKEDDIPGTVVATDVLRDLALVQVERVPNGIEALALAPQSTDVGQTVHSVGNPGASGALWVYTSGTVRQVYEKSWKTGKAPTASRSQGGQGAPGPGARLPLRQGLPGRPPGSRRPSLLPPVSGGAARPKDPEEGTEHRARVVETQSPTNPGDSGGPLVNDQAELVGVT